MSTEKITYPQYRKYSNGKAYFKIISATQFEEIQLLGNKKTLHLFDVKILPDRNYIYDLTYNYQNNWMKCDSEEYEKLKEAASYS